MVTSAEIKDRESLERWLEGRSSSTLYVLMFRIFARLLPIAWSRPYGELTDGRNTTFYLLRALMALRVSFEATDTQVLPIYQSPFSDGDWISLCKATSNVAEMDSSYKATSFLFHAIESPPFWHQRGEANFDDDVKSRICEIFFPDGEAFEISSERTGALVGNMLYDAVKYSTPKNLIDAPLWSDRNQFIREWTQTTSAWSESGADWGFWVNWYVGLLTGSPIGITLLTEIAGIGAPVWEAGPGAVAEAIARIEEKLRLRHEVERLQSELAGARSQVAAFSVRGHNNPPELVDPVAEVEGQAKVLAEALGAAERELRKDRPRAAVLRRISRALLDATGKFLTYCASLGDAALKKAAEEVGSAGAKALIWSGLIVWVSQLEAVQALARALEAFAK